jgi:hypothetical protein
MSEGTLTFKRDARRKAIGGIGYESREPRQTVGGLSQ